MLQNFVILNQADECIFLRNYGGGEALSPNLVTGLSSCVSTLLAVTRSRGGASGVGSKQAEEKKERSGVSERKDTSSGASTEAGRAAATAAKAVARREEEKDIGEDSRVCALTLNQLTWFYLDVGGVLTLIAQGNEGAGASYLSVALLAVEEVLKYYLGALLDDPTHTSSARDISDIVNSVLVRFKNDPALLVHGVRWVFLDQEKRALTDRVLAGVEAAHSSIQGVALVLGSSIVHARMPALDTRMIVHHLIARPLSSGCKVRCVPVCDTSNVWHYLVFLKFRHMTLVVLTNVRVSLDQLCAALEPVESRLAESLMLPVEEPPVLLRHYTGHDTISFVYTHIPTGVTVAPPARPGPAPEQERTTQAFTMFFSRAIEVLSPNRQSSSGDCEMNLHMQGFRFSAWIAREFELYALYSERVQPAQVHELNKEILRNVARHMHEEEWQQSGS